MKLKVLYKIAIVLSGMILTMQSCRQNIEKETLTEQQKADKAKRVQAELHLGTMLNNREFEKALRYIDSLHTVYPNNPPYYFAKGWVYDMQGDSIRAHIAYMKALHIYDSLISIKPAFNELINRSVVVQILYGMDAYNQALDEIQSTIDNFEDSLGIQYWRKYVFKKEELEFGDDMPEKYKVPGQ